MAERVCIVSLGDSIATGTLTPFSKVNSYVAYLPGKFREKGLRPEVYNLAHDGDASGDLLWKLTHSRRFRNIVEQADFITLSIGGNDLLRACSIPGFARIDLPAAQRGTRRFADNWPLIIDRVRELNPDAQLVVLNLYNPYDQTRRDGRLHRLTDRFLTEINGAIAAYGQNRYRVADTYAAFGQYAGGRMGRVTCLYPADSVLRNPHPTPRAQRMIADLIWGQFVL